METEKKILEPIPPTEYSDAYLRRLYERSKALTKHLEGVEYFDPQYFSGAIIERFGLNAEQSQKVREAITEPRTKRFVFEGAQNLLTQLGEDVNERGELLSLATIWSNGHPESYQLAKIRNSGLTIANTRLDARIFKDKTQAVIPLIQSYLGERGQGKVYIYEDRVDILEKVINLANEAHLGSSIVPIWVGQGKYTEKFVAKFGEGEKAREMALQYARERGIVPASSIKELAENFKLIRQSYPGMHMYHLIDFDNTLLNTDQYLEGLLVEILRIVQRNNSSE